MCSQMRSTSAKIQFFFRLPKISIRHFIFIRCGCTAQVFPQLFSDKCTCILQAKEYFSKCMLHNNAVEIKMDCQKGNIYLIMFLLSYLLIFYYFILFQAPEECAVAITSIIRHHETEYFASLEVLNLFVVARVFHSFYLNNVHMVF